MTTTAPRPTADPGHGPRMRRRWTWAVSAVLVAWLGAQAAAGWKFANGTTYPVVGAAMFNGPPNGSGHDFLVPRVYAVDAGGGRVEIDQHTFGIEPFEWRRWVKRHLEDVDDAHATHFAEQLAELYADTWPDSPTFTTIELWRVPAPAPDGGTMIRRVVL